MMQRIKDAVRAAAEGLGMRPPEQNPARKLHKKVLKDLEDRFETKYTFGGLSLGGSIAMLVLWFPFRYMPLPLMIVFSSLLFALSVGLLTSADSNRRLRRRVNHYLTLLIERPWLTLDELGGTLDRTGRHVRKDFRKLINLGLLSGGYFTPDAKRFILPGSDEPAPAYEQAWQSEEPAREKASAKAQSEPMTEEERLIAEISALGSRIKDEPVKIKVAKIESVCRNIFRSAEGSQQKKQQIRTFMNYYLPTTLKILDAYARYEEHGLTGANVKSASQNIEGILDKLVSGFEKQLDRLYEGEVMDITAEVEALENMLAMDGLASSGMTMPGGS